MSLFQPEKRMLKLGLIVGTAAVLLIAYLFLTSTAKEPDEEGQCEILPMNHLASLLC